MRAMVRQAVARLDEKQYPCFALLAAVRRWGLAAGAVKP